MSYSPWSSNASDLAYVEQLVQHLGLECTRCDHEKVVYEEVPSESSAPEGDQNWLIRLVVTYQTDSLAEFSKGNVVGFTNLTELIKVLEICVLRAS